MSFPEKFDKITQQIKVINPLMFWFHTLILAAVIYALSYGYYTLTGEAATGNRLFSQTFSNAGMIMIGLSFMMSGLTYFWNFVDKKIIYRKYIGLVGFYMTLVHIYFALKFAYDMPTRAFSNGGDVIAFLLGCLALAIFLEMALISNQYSVRELGNKAWRMILRTGYIAYLFAVVHLIIQKMEVWEKWMNGEMTKFPPLSLIIVAFSLVVFGMRIALWVALRNKEKVVPTVPLQPAEQPIAETNAGKSPEVI